MILLRTILPVALLAATAARGADALMPVDVRQVQVGGEFGRRIAVTVTNNLLKIDIAKDFLAPFQKKSADGGYIGLGKLMDSMVRLAALTGNPELLARKKHLVEETIKAQEPDGYLGLMKPDSRIWGMWDACEMGYIVYGLVSDYQVFGESHSLEAARKLADHLLRRWPTMPHDWAKQTRIANDVSLTGFDRAFLALHAATGDRRYLDFCIKDFKLPDWDRKITIGRRGGIEGHAYAYGSHCVAQLELHRLQPDERLLRQTLRAMEFMMANNGAAITGGVGQCEIWTADQDGRGELAETCATTYLVFIYDNLLRIQGHPRWGDLLERTLYNTAFAAQSPDGRRLRYYAPFEGPRVYFPKDTYCCPCNYRRIIAALPQLIYYRAGKGVAVNLYSASQAKLECGDGLLVVVRQETDYPGSGRVAIHVEPSRTAVFPLLLRIPGWCSGASASVNGRKITTPAAAGSFLTIEREWKSGDRVTLDLPMPWRFVAGRQRQAGRAAIMRGPLLYTLNPAPDKLLAQLDAADLTRLVLIPSTLEPVIANNAVRPGGTACRLKASNHRMGRGDEGNLTLTLTEFPDPDGKCCYFTLPDLSIAVADELTTSSR